MASSPHTGNTGKISKVKLESSIQLVAWSARGAAAGGSVGLEIFTRYVGNGSEMEIELSDQGGKKFGKFKEKMAGNKFWADIKVPADARQALFAEVKLPKHSLTQKSGPLVVLPAVQITNVKWDKTEARRGDILKLSADVKGAPDGTECEVQIWEHDSDGAHEPVVKLPALLKNGKVELEWEYQYFDDTAGIPTAQEAAKGYKPPEYFFRVTVFGSHGDSGLLRFKDWIDIRLNNQKGDPIPDENYVVTFADGSQRKGKLDKEGKATEKDVMPGKYTIEFPDL